MAKGFTVKAKAPTKEEPKWDIPAIKERWKGKTIVFCLPGRGCSYTFLKNFVQLSFDMVQSGMSIQTVSYTHSPSPRDRQKSRMPSSA